MSYVDFTLKEEFGTRLLKCGLHTVTSKQRRKGEIRRWRNLTNTASARWSRSTWTVMSQVGSMYPSQHEMKWHYPSVLFLPRAHNFSLTMRKTSCKSQWRDILQTTSPGLKTVKMVKTRESLQSCHRPGSLRR